MYKIIYQKSNGNIFERFRSSLPTHTIGETTSMGWKIKDILYSFKNGYYSYSEYKILTKKYYKKRAIKCKIKLFFKKYASSVFLIIILPLLFLK